MNLKSCKKNKEYVYNFIIVIVLRVAPLSTPLSAISCPVFIVVVPVTISVVTPVTISISVIVSIPRSSIVSITIEISIPIQPITIVTVPVPIYTITFIAVPIP